MGEKKNNFGLLSRIPYGGKERLTFWSNHRGKLSSRMISSADEINSLWRTTEDLHRVTSLTPVLSRVQPCFTPLAEASDNHNTVGLFQEVENRSERKANQCIHSGANPPESKVLDTPTAAIQCSLLLELHGDVTVNTGDSCSCSRTMQLHEY